MSKITKKHLASALEQRHNLKPAQAMALVNDMLKCVVENLERGNSIMLDGIGLFKVKEMSARKFYALGRDISIEARHVLKFKPSSIMKKRLKSLKQGKTVVSGDDIASLRRVMKGEDE